MKKMMIGLPAVMVMAVSAGSLLAFVAKEASTPPRTSSVSATETAFGIVIFIVKLFRG